MTTNPIIGDEDLAQFVRGGVEACTHWNRIYYNLFPDHAIIKVDVKNAFGSVNPQKVLDVGKEIPELAPAIAQSYLNPSTVIYEDNRKGTRLEIKNQKGVIQGGALSSVLFSVSQSKAVRGTKLQHPDVHIVGIADDQHIAGPPMEVLRAFKTYKKLLKDLLDLELQPKKCIAISKNGTAPFADQYREAGIKLEEGILVGGSPVGTDRFVGREVDKMVAEIVEHTEKIKAVATQGQLMGRKQILQELESRWEVLCGTHNYTGARHLCLFFLLGFFQF